MKKRFTEHQIVKSVTLLKNGTPIKELSREIDVTTTTVYAWQKKYKKHDCERSQKTSCADVERC